MKKRYAAYEYMPRQLLKRHWVWLFVWYAFGMLMARHAGDAAPFYLLITGMLGGGLLLVPGAIPRRSYMAVAVLALATGLGVYALREHPARSDGLHQFALEYPRQRLTFEGVVRRPSLYNHDAPYTTFVLHVQRVYLGDTPLPLRGRALVRWQHADRPLYADMEVSLSGSLSPHLSVVNHNVRSMEDHFRAQGIRSQIQVAGRAVRPLREGHGSPRYWASRLRQWQSDHFTEVVPAPAYPFIAGVWLGDRSQIAWDLYQQFVQAGTAHVLAVSGVHVAIIALSLRFLLRLLRVPVRLRVLSLAFVIALFALMTGARTGTLRAATMLVLYLASEFFDREPDAPSALGLAGCLFLTWRPALLFDVGFLLSFGSVASILLFHPLLYPRLRWLPLPVAMLLATTLAVQIVTFPIALWHFSQASVLGVVANLVVVPLLSIILWLCLVVSVVVTVFSPLAVLLGHAMLPLITAVHWVNGLAVSVPGAYMQALRPTVVSVVLYGAGVMMLYQTLSDERNRQRNALLTTGLFLVALVFWRPIITPATVDFIDVGRGDAIFVRTPGGTTLLVDGGDKSAFVDAGARAVAPFLYANGVHKLDYVVVSHAHRDHIGGLFHIVEQFPVGTVLMGPERDGEHRLELEFLALCQARGVAVRRLHQGDAIPAKDAQISVLHPPSEWAQYQTENNRSLVLHLAWPGISLLLTGDIETEAEKRLVEHVPPMAVLKIPHHGSPTSSTEAMLDRVMPQAAVASLAPTGARASLMPTQMVTRYGERGIALYRTDWHGGVRLRPEKGRIAIYTARGVRGYSLAPVAKTPRLQ